MKATWYFDFISPFAYLQLGKILDLAQRIEIEPVPILFASVLDSLRQRGPAEIPAKRVFAYQFVQWQAERDGIALRFPPAHPFNPLPTLRLCVAAGTTWLAVQAIFEQVWQSGNASDSAHSLMEVARRLGIDDVAGAVAAPEVKQTLHRNTQRALAAEVFGVPTLQMDEHQFWGNDATDMAIAYLDDPARFASAEYQRLATLPIGIARKQG